MLSIMEPASLVLLPHTGRVSLHLGHVLVHETTHELYLLDGAAEWRLDFADDGFAFVTADGRGAMWIADVMRYNLYKSEGGDDLWVLDRMVDEVEDCAIPLQQLVSERSAGRVLKLVGGSLTSLILHITSWRCPQDGARCWVSLGALYKSLGMRSHKGSPSRWLSHGWLAWQRFGEAFGLPASHLRDRSECSHHGDRSAKPPEGGIVSVPESKSVSSHTLVALLARWAHEVGKNNLKSPGERRVSRPALAILLDKAFEDRGPHFANIFLASEVFHRQGTWSGRSLLRFCIRNARVDFRKIVEQSRQINGAIARALAGEDLSDAHLADVLIKLASVPCCMWLFRQLVWVAGIIVDQHLAKVTELNGTERQLKNMSPAEVERDLAKYFLAHSRAFFGQTDVSMALDASRVGQKNVVLAVLALENNIAMAVPPQARRGHSECISFTKLRLCFTKFLVRVRICVFSVFFCRSAFLLNPFCGLLNVFCGLVNCGFRESVVFRPPLIPGCTLEVIEDYVSDRLFVKPEQLRPHEQWQAQALRWLGKRKADQSGEVSAPKKRKVHRKKTYLWLRAVDSILQRCTGRSLMAWAPHPPLAPLSWPHLSIAADQGSDALAGQYWMKMQCLANVTYWPDISHGVQRDLELTWKDLRLTSLVRLVTVVMNISHGPFDDGARFHQLAASTSEYLRTKGPDECPLFKQYILHLASDLGLESAVGTAGLEERIWAELQAHWSLQRRNPKVALCRFGAFIQHVSEFDSNWHFMLIQVLHYCMQEGLFDPDTARLDLKEAAKESGGNGSEQRTTMKSHQDPVARLRASCRGNLHVAAIILGEPRHQMLCRAMFLLSSKVMEWYSEQSKRLRSVGETRAWLMQQAVGGLLAPLRETVKLLSDATILGRCGMGEEELGDLSRLDANHVEVAKHGDAADMMGKWVLKLLSHRVRRMLFLTSGWQGFQGRLVAGTEQQQNLSIGQLRAECEALDKAKLQSGTFWSHMTARSHLNWMANVQLRMVLEGEGWRCTDTLRGFVNKRLRVVAQSKIIEDYFCMCGTKENAQTNKLMSEKSMWQTMISKDVLGSVHRFGSAPWHGEAVPKGDAGRISKDMFYSKHSDTPKAIRKVPSLSSTPPWYSSSPEHGNIVYADMQLMLLASRRNCWAQVASGAMATTLFRSATIVVRRATSMSWVFSLGDVSGHAVLAWPALPVLEGDQIKFFMLDPAGKPNWLTPIDFDSWVACSIVWRSPAEQALRHLDGLSLARFSLVAEPKAEPRKLIDEAAHCAFWDLGGSSLDWVARKLGMEWDKTQTLCEKVLGLVKHILPALSETEALDIVAQRMLRPTQLFDELLQTDGADEAVHESDRKEWEQDKASVAKESAKQVAIAEEWRGLKRAAVEKERCQKKRKPTVLKNASGRRYPSAMPTHELSRLEACELCPPSWVAYSDAANGRWQVFSGERTFSRSWHVYGNRHALQLCLQASWDAYLLFQGMQRSECPIRDLFANSSSSSSSAP